MQQNRFKNNPLRQAYEQEVKKLKNVAQELLNQGETPQEAARTVHQARRDLGIIYKDATPQPLRDYIYEINIIRYGDPLGPTFEKMVKSKTYEEIIESASRPNSDINNYFLDLKNG